MRPDEIAESTGAEIMLMWEGHDLRRREFARPLAVQTFYTLSMFSTDVTLELMLKAFGVVDE